MTTIVTRAGKGSPLTNNEVDTNFTNLNTAKLETLTSTDTSVTITGTGSTRNLSVPVNPAVVSGPASSTDNAIARYDLATGKLIQNSLVIVDDTGSVTGVAGLDTVNLSVTGTLSFDAAQGTAGQVLTSAGTGATPTWTTPTVGTVTSVTGTSPVASSGGATPAISLASGYGDTLNPYASKTANFVLAAPTGASGVPVFRAVVAADIPTLNQNTTGTANNVTGVVAPANGGTGLTAPGTAGNVLTSNGSSWVSSTPGASGATVAKAAAFAIIFGY